MLVIAALTTCTKGGAIPQARHGGMSVCSFAAVGSKFEGIGFENEHIGHIHVAFAGITGACLYPLLTLPWLTPGPAEPGRLAVCRDDRDRCFAAFGCRVIFGEDFRNPACAVCQPQ